MNINAMITKLYHSKLIRYAVIGGTSTLIHLSIAFLWLYAVNKSFFFANAAGFCVAYLFSYTVQSRYVFLHPLSLPKAFRYFLVQFGALLVSLFLSDMLVGYNSYIKTLIVVILLPLITFVIHKLWTFRRH
ncbi:MAG: GtrA family protein [Sulfuricurvum sp.]|uniref:GtrA family protein n=1 Tax=Sulfuricurvum sp. TaxID=2025608 RepID=UPI0026213E6B|nr:GtrA family protein [Sulfuricurvum sp.]MDD2369523.1 GtrA family protein [Sulfuricurvum sp.]MDD5117466.1 GtrA family protein [Sulfuricurvum sp.]